MPGAGGGSGGTGDEARAGGTALHESYATLA